MCNARAAKIWLHRGDEGAESLLQAVRNTGSAALRVPWTLEVWSGGYRSCTTAWNWGSPVPAVSNGLASGPVTQVGN